MLIRLSRFTCAALVTLGCAAAVQAAPANSWPMDGHDAQKTHRNLGEKSVRPATFAGMQVVWQYGLGQFYLGMPSQLGSSVQYVCSNLATVRALDTASTAQLWARSDLPGGHCGNPTVDAGSVYVATYRNAWGNEPTTTALTALDPATGSTRWSTRITSDELFGLLDPTQVGRTLYVPDGRDRVYAFHADSGAQLWSAGTCSLNNNASVKDGVVVVTTWSSYCNETPAVWAFDAATGAVKWKQETVSLGAERPALIMGQRAIVTLRDGSLRAYDLQSGTLQWQTAQATAWAAGGPAASADETRFYLPAGNAVIEFDAATGQESRRFTLPKNYTAGSNLVVLSNSIVLTLSYFAGGQHLAMVNLRTGKVMPKHSYSMGGDYARVSVVGGRVRVSSGGSLYTFTPAP